MQVKIEEVDKRLNQKRKEIEKERVRKLNNEPRPSRAFGDEIITSENELRDRENPFFFESRNSTRSGNSLNSSFESFVNLL